MTLCRMPMDVLEPRRLLAVVPAGFTDSQFGPNLLDGTAMEFAPDGRLFIALQGGTVHILDAQGNLSTALTLSVNRPVERGLLGLTLSPTFSSDNLIYLYYTEIPQGGDANTVSPTRNRISRFTVSGNTINPASEQVLVRLDPLDAGNHNGGALHFGPDGKLYVGVGENAVPANSQLATNRHGKLLRLNPDGTIPSDNPSTVVGIGATSGDNRAIYAAGLRNPFTFAFSPVDGRMLINDVGQSAYEEINLGAAGANYGWPGTEGKFDAGDNPNYTNPIYAYEHDDTSTTGQSITGGAFYSSQAPGRFPDTFQGKYFFGDLVSGWINYIDPANPPSALNAATPFATEVSTVVDIDVGPDGALYYLQRGNYSTIQGSVHRIVAPSRPSVSLTSKGTLYVNGTSGNDEIVIGIKRGKLRVTTNGVMEQFTLSRLKRGQISGANGNDVVTLGSGIIGLTLDGGAGNDSLRGGDFADLLLGGDGDDRLEGNGGRDTLDGGSGRDTLFGGTSIDRLIGGGGRDRSDYDKRERRTSIEILM